MEPGFETENYRGAVTKISNSTRPAQFIPEDIDALSNWILRTIIEPVFLDEVYLIVTQEVVYPSSTLPEMIKYINAAVLISENRNYCTYKINATSEAEIHAIMIALIITGRDAFLFSKSAQWGFEFNHDRVCFIHELR